MSHTNPPIINYPQNSIRRRAKRGAYIKNGMVKLSTPPATSFILLFLMVVIITTWKVPTIFAAKLISISAFVPVFICALRISILLVAVLFFVIVLYLIGTPHKAREIENDLAATFGIAKTSPLFYRCPFLVACEPVKGTALKVFVFWSKWLDVEKWNQPKTKQTILWALDVHSDEDFAVGKGRYTVTIRAASGAVPEERETPQDPLFM